MTKESKEKAAVVKRAIKQLEYRGGAMVLRAMLKYVDKNHSQINRALINTFIELCDDRTANP